MQYQLSIPAANKLVAISQSPTRCIIPPRFLQTHMLRATIRSNSSLVAKASSDDTERDADTELMLPAAPEDVPTPDGELPPIEEASRLLPASDSRFQGLKAFVAGATGRTGREIVSLLNAEGVPVRALVRNAVKAVETLPSVGDEVEVVEGDVYRYEDITPAIQGCNVVCVATGASMLSNPLDPFRVDYEGTKNIIAAAKLAGVKKFVLVTSIGIDEILSPFNLFGGLAFWKKQAELELQRSGIEYTIVRPGGLRSELGEGQKSGGVVIGKAGTWGLLPGQKFPTASILRKQVAACVVEALVEPAAANKVVEIVTDTNTPNRTYAELFSSVS